VPLVKEIFLTVCPVTPLYFYLSIINVNQIALMAIIQTLLIKNAKSVIVFVELATKYLHVSLVMKVDTYPIILV
jgi:hypothetical protein